MSVGSRWAGGRACGEHMAPTVGSGQTHDGPELCLVLDLEPGALSFHTEVTVPTPTPRSGWGDLRK